MIGKFFKSVGADIKDLGVSFVDGDIKTKGSFLIFCFAAMLYPCYDWVMFMHRKYTATLKIRFDIMYFPFVVFNVLTLAHLIYDFVKDLMSLFRKKGGVEG